LLSANIQEQLTGQTKWLPFKVYRFGDWSVGVIALTTPAIEDFDLPWKWKGLKFENPIKVAKNLVSQLKDQKVDVIVVLAHSGIEYDPLKRRRVSESSKKTLFTHWLQRYQILMLSCSVILTERLDLTS